MVRGAGFGRLEKGLKRSGAAKHGEVTGAVAEAWGGIERRPPPPPRREPHLTCRTPRNAAPQGRAVVAVETPTWPDASGGSSYANEYGLTPSQVTSTYIFPGVGEWGWFMLVRCMSVAAVPSERAWARRPRRPGAAGAPGAYAPPGRRPPPLFPPSHPAAALGAQVSRCTRLRDEQFIAAAEAVARLVTEDDRVQGLSLPPLHQIREVGAPSARAARRAFVRASDWPRPGAARLLVH